MLEPLRGALRLGPPPMRGPARQNEIADTLRKLRKLVIFSGEELTENLPLYFNSALLEELESIVEDAKLYMQGQERTARLTGQRQWLARGGSPERELEKRAARAISWAEFSQAEVDAMTPSMRRAMTTRLATQAAAAAKAKARAEAEEIGREVSRRKKAERDARVAEAAMENVKKEAARKKLEVLAAIEEGGGRASPPLPDEPPGSLPSFCLVGATSTSATLRSAPLLATGMRPTLSSGAPACALNAALGRATAECCGS